MAKCGIEWGDWCSREVEFSWERFVEGYLAWEGGVLEVD